VQLEGLKLDTEKGFLMADYRVFRAMGDPRFILGRGWQGNKYVFLLVHGSYAFHSLPQKTEKQRAKSSPCNLVSPASWQSSILRLQSEANWTGLEVPLC
jgi:hypothetical protein